MLHAALRKHEITVSDPQCHTLVKRESKEENNKVWEVGGGEGLGGGGGGLRRKKQ